MRFLRSFMGLILLAAIGCGPQPPKFVPVSGTVTLNGQPLVNAMVSFQPIAEPGTAIVAPGSSGKTNEKGEFKMKVSTGGDGAWVGKHRVIISQLAATVGASDERPPRGGWPMTDKVPKRYNTESKETFDVPPEGTDKADFKLTSP